MSGSFRKWAKVRFITGFFVTVPVIATSWLLYVFWDAIDEFFSPGYARMFGRRIPGLGFLTAVVVIFGVGTVATNVVGRRILIRVERLLTRVPIFRSIYPTIKELLESFSPEKRTPSKEWCWPSTPARASSSSASSHPRCSWRAPRGSGRW